MIRNHEKQTNKQRKTNTENKKKKNRREGQVNLLNRAYQAEWHIGFHHCVLGISTDLDAVINLLQPFVARSDVKIGACATVDG